MFNTSSDLYFDDLLDSDSIEFDLFEIVTPGGLDRRVQTLDAAWLQLFNDSSGNPYIASEFAKWRVWAENVLNQSWISKGWATGLLAELDEWKARYSEAHKRAASNAPSPLTLEREKPFFESPIFWIVAGIGIAAGIYYYARKK